VLRIVEREGQWVEARITQLRVAVEEDEHGEQKRVRVPEPAVTDRATIAAHLAAFGSDNVRELHRAWRSAITAIRDEEEVLREFYHENYPEEPSLGRLKNLLKVLQQGAGLPVGGRLVGSRPLSVKDIAPGAAGSDSCCRAVSVRTTGVRNVCSGSIAQGPACRHHHRLKTHARGWDVEQHLDGQVTFTAPTGHSYTSWSHEYRTDTEAQPDPSGSRVGSGLDPFDRDPPPL
jgi:hypothetical protein